MFSIPLKLRTLLKRIRCIFACCGSTISIENSEIDGKPNDNDDDEQDT